MEAISNLDNEFCFGMYQTLHNFMLRALLVKGYKVIALL